MEECCTLDRACYLPRMRLVLGTRGSELARAQSLLVAAVLRARGHEVVVEVVVTRGDKETHAPVPQLGGKGLFTAELEAALHDGAIDLAVHSLQDLPTEDVDGLAIVAVPARADPGDALVAAARLAELPAGARIGTASLRRRAMVLRRRPDLVVVDLRGNVGTRLAKVADGALEGVVLATAGLERLGRTDAIREALDFLPAPAQGALGVQARADRADVREALGALHDPLAAACTTAERALLHTLGGGCSVPVGALAEPARRGRLHLRACVVSVDGTRCIEAEGDGADPAVLGREVAAELVARGAQEILDAGP
jgi:hydroxymethylbilane synthase